MSYKLPGLGPRGYSTYVDEYDVVWVSDFMANAILRFDPKTASWVDFPADRPISQLLQMNGRHDEVWGGEQGASEIVLIEEK